MPSRSVSRSQRASSLSPPVWVVLAVLGLVISLWSAGVNSVVTEPYLDEVFHVSQATHYLRGNYHVWDPKITTPPGLYALSTLLSWLTGLSSTASLRAINGILLPSIVLLLLDTEVQLRLYSLDNRKSSQSEDEPTFSFHQLHTAFNVALFPPLFFFSALYYTDIASLISVLVCWNHFLRSHNGSLPAWRDDLLTIVYGLFSLTFRQTNIFFVSILPIALLLVSKYDIGFKDRDAEVPLLDPPVRESQLDDYLFFAMSLAQRLFRVLRLTVSGEYSIPKLIRLFYPHLVILGSFVAFVAWNGGVVLGDKSNHVATIHLSQMLYIWPYILFFSWPLACPYLLQAAFSLLTLLPFVGHLEGGLMFRRRKAFPRITVLVGAIMLTSIIVHYNTIVHPFTLADNRHYMFYVFRRLMMHPAIRFLATPVYCIGAWAVVQSLGAPASIHISTNKQKQKANLKAKRTNPIDKAGPPPERPLRINLAVAGEGAPVSFVAVWFATSALQLVSAPLVEPRYFILPWVMWRLRVPKAGSDERQQRNWWSGHDHRLWIETAWFLLVNAVTGYIFLYRGFEWAQEAGKIQRFMW